jgi:membrane dipeptidase
MTNGPDEVGDLHRASIVIDTHSDALGAVVRGERRLGERSIQGQFDLPRALDGGITAELLAIYLHDPRPGSCMRQTVEYLDAYHREVESFSDLAVAATKADDILRAKEQGKVALILSMEGAEALEGDLSFLRICHRLGLRSLGITWNRRNEAADGVGELRTGGGLSQFGVELVKECNRLGILIDMAHLAPAGVEDVLEVSEAPVVVTHGNCYDLWPGSHEVPWPRRRSLTDAQLEAIAAKGGVVGVTAVPAFLGNDEKRAPLGAMLDHIDHMVKVMGEDAVGIGSDFDGVRDARVEGLEDASKMPHLTGGLIQRGYGPQTIQKILGGNFLRVFRQVIG